MTSFIIRLSTLSITAVVMMAAAVGIASASQGTVEGREHLVGSRTALERTLAYAISGDSILLAPGTYRNVRLRGFWQSMPITIRSADPTRPARVSQLTIQKSANLVIKNLVFMPDHGSMTGDGDALISVEGSQSVTIADSVIEGAVSNPAEANGIGARFVNSEKITFQGNRISKFLRGALFSGVRQAEVRDNAFIDLRSDGADFTGVQDVLIENNIFESFHPAPNDHADFIQFWQLNAPIENTRDVVIRGNILLQGLGGPVQGIFVGNEVKGRIYRNFIVEDNVIYTSSAHGITLAGATNARIAYNTVVKFPNGPYSPRINLYGGTDIEITGNVVSGLRRGNASGVMARNNVFTEEGAERQRLALNSLFRQPEAGPMAVKESFMPLSGGPLDRPYGDRVGALSLKTAPRRRVRRANSKIVKEMDGTHLYQ